MANILAIVGRPNVGKSTLFNRLVEARKAIMDDVSGVTRDRHYGYGEWAGRHFTVIDTGGYVEGSEDIFEKAIRDQVKMALEEANVIIFMLDSITGLTDLDKDFARILRSVEKPVVLAGNKADNQERSFAANEFYELGMGEVFPVSSVNGSGTGELLDEVVKHFSVDEEDNGEEGIPKIAILGRPNVGKSSFLNALIGRERSIVTDISGTTRDSINTRYNLFNKDLLLIDTAGIRKKSRVKENIEFYSVMRAIQALQDADICIVIIDAAQGLESQDINIISLAHKYRKGIVLMINKWDLINKEQDTYGQFVKDIQNRLGQFTFIPILFTSVINKQRIFQVIEKADEVYQNRKMKISTSKLNNVLLEEINRNPPPAVKGKYIKIKYVTQISSKSPIFAFFCNFPQYIGKTYERFLENKIRLHFGFEGVPVQIFFRKK